MNAVMSGPATSTQSPIWQVAARLLRNRSFLIGAGLVLAIALVAIFADVLAPFDPLRNSFRTRLRSPDATYWFGTDHFGRDILSRVLFGARISLTIGILTALVT